MSSLRECCANRPGKTLIDSRRLGLNADLRWADDCGVPSDRGTGPLSHRSGPKARQGGDAAAHGASAARDDGSRCGQGNGFSLYAAMSVFLPAGRLVMDTHRLQRAHRVLERQVRQLLFGKGHDVVDRNEPL